MTTEEEHWMVHQTFRTTEAEDEIIRQKMKVFGVKKKSAFFRTMILNGYLLKLELPEIREALRLLKNLTNNVNQIAAPLKHFSADDQQLCGGLCKTQTAVFL